MFQRLLMIGILLVFTIPGRAMAWHEIMGNVVIKPSTHGSSCVGYYVAPCPSYGMGSIGPACIEMNPEILAKEGVKDLLSGLGNFVGKSAFINAHYVEGALVLTALGSPVGDPTDYAYCK